MDHKFFIIGGPGFGFGGDEGGFYNPTFSDPAKFPRAEPVLNDELILRLEQVEAHNQQLKELADKIVELREQANIVKADMEAQRARVFPQIRKLHPEVVKGYGFGFRQHDGRFYAVGWDMPTSPEQPHHHESGE